MMMSISKKECDAAVNASKGIHWAERLANSGLYTHASAANGHSVRLDRTSVSGEMANGLVRAGAVHWHQQHWSTSAHTEREVLPVSVTAWRQASANLSAFSVFSLQPTPYRHKMRGRERHLGALQRMQTQMKAHWWRCSVAENGAPFAACQCICQ